MRCIVDYVQFCQKLMILPDQLELVEECILKNVDLESPGRCEEREKGRGEG